MLSSSILAVSSMLLISLNSVYSQTSSVQICMTANNCGSDTTCIAKCVTSAGPTHQQSEDTLACFTDCQKLTNAPGVFEACNKGCETKFFLAPNSSPSSTSSSVKASSTGVSKSSASVPNSTNSASNQMKAGLLAVSALSSLFFLL